RECDAAAGRAAIVRIEDGVAAGGRHLSGARVARHPAVAHMRLRAAVDDEDQRVALPRFLVERMYEHGLELEAGPGLPLHGVLLRESNALELGIAPGELTGLIAWCECVKLRRMLRGLGEKCA